MYAAGRERLAALAPALSAEYDLGELVRVEVLGAVGHGTFKVLTPRGAFVAKRPWRPDDVALYGRVEELFNSRGIAQPRLLSTRTNAFVADCGYFLCEFLDGTVTTRPTRRQTLAVMAHLAEYLRALTDVDIEWQPDEKNFWSRVADIDYLLSVLPRHLDDGSEQDRRVLEAAIDHLSDNAAGLGQLRTQLVHGDVAPDNVVMAGDRVVAIIDFTPFREPALFAIACALYWFHVHGRAALPLDEVAASMEAVVRGRPWTKAELSLAPAMLVRE